MDEQVPTLAEAVARVSGQFQAGDENADAFLTHVLTHPDVVAAIVHQSWSDYEAIIPAVAAGVERDTNVLERYGLSFLSDSPAGEERTNARKFAIKLATPERAVHFKAAEAVLALALASAARNVASKEWSNIERRLLGFNVLEHVVGSAKAKKNREARSRLNSLLAGLV